MLEGCVLGHVGFFGYVGGTEFLRFGWDMFGSYYLYGIKSHGS
jgi:hypothetical protein